MGAAADQRLEGISAVVPVFNSAESIPELVARLCSVLASLADDYEVILVDDCSPDNSWAVIQDIAADNPRLRGFRLSRNFGQHNALLCGIREARQRVIVTLDDDLQHPPEEIPKLVAALQEGHDVVYGRPDHIRNGLWRGLASRTTKLAMKTGMGVNNAPDVSAFRVFRGDLKAAFADYRSPHASVDVLLTWATTDFTAVTVAHNERRYGESNYTLFKLISHAMNMTTGYSTLPLRLASMIGFVFTLLGIAVLIYVVVRFLISGYSIPGFPFLASIIAIFSGAQLFALGIIGEYLARIHLRTMDRPTYILSSTTDDPSGR